MTTKKRKSKYHRLIICLALSLLAWFAVKMSKNYTQTYQFAVEFVNLPSGKSLSHQSDTVISVTVSGKGVFLLKYELGRKKIKIDYAAIATSEQRNSSSAAIKKKQLNTYLIKQLDFPENAVINEPAQINLEFETLTR